MKKILLPVLTVCFLSISSVHAEKLPLPTVYEKADALDAKFAYEPAIAFLETANKENPGNAEILSRLSREYTLSMSNFQDKETKIERGKKAVDYALLAYKADPENPKSSICASVSYGRLATVSDAKTRIGYSREVKKYADRAAKLDPQNDLPWHVLGVWNFEIASLNPILKGLAGAIYGKVPDASFEDAARYLEKALALNPKRTGNVIELGRVYVELGRKAEGKEYLEKGLAMPLYDHDDGEAKRRGRVALEKL